MTSNKVCLKVNKLDIKTKQPDELIQYAAFIIEKEESGGSSVISELSVMSPIVHILYYTIVHTDISSFRKLGKGSFLCLSWPITSSPIGLLLSPFWDVVMYYTHYDKFLPYNRDEWSVSLEASLQIGVIFTQIGV